MEENSETYIGNMFWILSLKKKVLKDLDPKALDLTPNSSKINIYESLFFNEETEDSLFFQTKNELYEYFNDDKFDSFHKLLKIYEGKYYSTKKNHTTLSTESANSELYERKEYVSPFRNMIKQADNIYVTMKKKEITVERERKQIKVIPPIQILKRISISSETLANMLIIYSNKERLWVPKFEVKSLAFYWKFIPNYNKIKVIKLFPLFIESIDSILITYEGKEDVAEQDEISKVFLKKRQSVEYDVCEKYYFEIKKEFSEKYGLDLRSFKLELVVIDKIYYLLDVHKLILKKYSNKDPKMKVDKFISVFKEKHSKKNLQFSKDTANIKEEKVLFDSMKDVYDRVYESFKVPKPIERDKRPDESFKELRPNCPYKFSELISEEMSEKVFRKYCSNKLMK